MQTLPLPYHDRCSTCSRAATPRRIEKVPSPCLCAINFSYIQVAITSVPSLLSLLRPGPCRTLHLLRYIVFLARSLSASSIPNYLNVVRLLHLQYGYPNSLEEPLFKHQKTLLMRGIKRLHGAQVSQKLPITPDVLYKMQCHLNFACSFDATFWAACLVAVSRSSANQICCRLQPQNSTPGCTYETCTCDVRLYPWGIILVVRKPKSHTPGPSS